MEESTAYEYGTLSFRDFLGYYWKKRKVFYWSLAIFLIIGLFYALFSAEEYTSDTSITPEYELQDQVNEIIESYSMLFGLSSNRNNRRYRSYSDFIEQYPQIISSTSFHYRLMQQPFYYDERDSSITMFDYFTDIHRPSLTGVLYRYTFGLPSLLGSNDSQQADTGSVIEPSQSDEVQQISSATGAQFPILDLDSRTRSVINELSSRVSAGLDQQARIVRIQAKMPEPELAATLAQLTLEVLNERARELKNEKARLFLEYLEGQQDEALSELENARRDLIQTGDTENQLISERLEQQSNYEASLDRYNSIVEQINRIQADTANQQPVFRVVDDITVPKQKSEPDRLLIVSLSLLTGLFLAVCWVTIMFFASRLK